MEGVDSLAFANQDAILISADETTHVWDAETGVLLRTFENQRASSLVGLPHHPVFLAAHLPVRDGWEGAICHAEHGYIHHFPGKVSYVAATPDGLSSITVTSGPTIRKNVLIWNIRPLLETWGQGPNCEDPEGSVQESIDLIAGPLDNPEVCTRFAIGEVLSLT